MAATISMRDVQFQDVFQSIRYSPDLDALVQRVFSLAVKILVTLHDLLIVPVHCYVRPLGPHTANARELLLTCSPERVRNQRYCCQQLADVLGIYKKFYEELAKNFIGKIEGEQSKNYQERIWESLTAQVFVDTYLFENPANMNIFLDVVLKSYV